MFDYHMYGEDVGSLYLDVYSAVSKRMFESVWTSRGSHGRHWKTAEVRSNMRCIRCRFSCKLHEHGVYMALYR